jgi:hypothetical protein
MTAAAQREEGGTAALTAAVQKALYCRLFCGCSSGNDMHTTAVRAAATLKSPALQCPMVCAARVQQEQNTCWIQATVGCLQATVVQKPVLMAGSLVSAACR